MIVLSVKGDDSFELQVKENLPAGGVQE